MPDIMGLEKNNKGIKYVEDIFWPVGERGGSSEACIRKMSGKPRINRYYTFCRNRGNNLLTPQLLCDFL